MVTEFIYRCLFLVVVAVKVQGNMRTLPVNQHFRTLGIHVLQSSARIKSVSVIGALKLLRDCIKSSSIAVLSLPR